MIPLTREERNFKGVMAISAITYLIAGFAFVFFPSLLLEALNVISRLLAPSLPEIPLAVEKFWLSMTFSMMMTISLLSYMVQLNVRKNKGYVVPLLTAKAASSLSGLAFFLFSARYLAYLVIFLVDGAIFWFTFFFYLMAHRQFLQEQISYFREKAPATASSGPALVVVRKGEDKFALLDQVLEEAKFYEILEKSHQKSGKPQETFSIVIKPNFMFMHSKKDYTTYTDPELVEHLVNRIVSRGFTNIALVESQCTYGNYYANREVVKVAEYIGYSRKKNYRLVDLTKEMVRYDYGGRLGKHYVGPTWRDADFRISFAKNKTHTFCHYTLALKNIYGTLPRQNKLKEYHTKREYDWPTIETMKHFPVHFGLIDAFISGDGQFGVITCPEPKHTKTIIGGENLIAVDWVGAKKMGLDPDDPEVGRFLPLAVAAFGKPEIIWVGDQSVYEPWSNVNEAIILSLDVIEEAYAFSNWWFSTLTSMDKYFTLKKKAWGMFLLRKIMAPIKRTFYPYDQL